MEAETLDTSIVKDTLSDSSKLATAIEKIKHNRRLVPQSMAMMKGNAQIERNMTNLAREMEGEMVMGMDTPLKERKKMAHKQELIRSQMKSNMKDDDYRCVQMLLSGRCVPHVVNLVALEKEEKWCVSSIDFDGQAYITVCDSTARISNKNLNKKASTIVGVQVYGLMSFLLLTDEFNIIDCNVKDFPNA